MYVSVSLALSPRARYIWHSKQALSKQVLLRRVVLFVTRISTVNASLIPERISPGLNHDPSNPSALLRNFHLYCTNVSETMCGTTCSQPLGEPLRLFPPFPQNICVYTPNPLTRSQSATGTTTLSFAPVSTASMKLAPHPHNNALVVCRAQYPAVVEMACLAP